MLESLSVERHPAASPLGLPIHHHAIDRFGLARAVDEARKGPLSPALRALADAVERAGGPVMAPSTLIAAATLHAILRYLAGQYCFDQESGVLERGLAAVADVRGEPVTKRPLDSFGALYARRVPTAEPHETQQACEFLLLGLAMENPALASLRPLFDDTALRDATPADALREALDSWLDDQPPVKGFGASLMTLLRAPMRASPDSLEGQLDFVLETWAETLPEGVRTSLLRAQDVVREATKARFSGPGKAEIVSFGGHGGGPGGGGGTAGGPEAVFIDDGVAEERFTRDRDWMPDVVLIAKLTHVWLDQLSKRYGLAITRLDQIPDEELDRIAGWGFTGLWLIGVWQRSRASRTIKQRMGNPDAMSSAYALYDYEIAHDLGGAAAHANLRDRLRARGMRLAGDMVPNHFGVDSRWVVQHPEWFLSLDEPPYPGYTFDGPDLSSDDRVGVFIEDGYWNHSDAAVVFKRFDRQTGDVRHIYHGNDGTQMPWNDTAQIDYLDPAAREAVIQTVLHVARQFPIIRFDAAMTLAKRHIRRLWHPPPGSGGDIPSRAEHAATPARFERDMPTEFWRDVVERIQAEAPDTLLLAEAFWLMEGYFVRTLGMHRVYNSAFMNMLRDEDNAGYRKSIQNVLEFSPAILERFVNFVSNPDERTAVDQFGKGDKYFGVATLMVTLPGLPMFGHGQVEGFAEKYGMEYPRAYYNEVVDEGLVAHHERTIFPLMRRRHLFSGVEHFALYDFVVDGGGVDHNVFAYSNRRGDDRALVVYNNAYSATRGRVRTSTPINVGTADQPQLEQRALVSALALHADEDVWYAFRDHHADAWYLRSGAELTRDGLPIELPGYQCHVFVDFREIRDADGSWAGLAASLQGQPVPNIDAAWRAYVWRSVIDSAADVFGAATEVGSGRLGAALRHLAAALDGRGVDSFDPDAALESLSPRLAIFADPVDGLIAAGWTDDIEWPAPTDDVSSPAPGLALATVRAQLGPRGGIARLEADLAARAIATAGIAGASALADACDALARLDGDWRRAIDEPRVQRWLEVNAHEGVRWLNRERMLTLAEAVARTSVAALLDAPPATAAARIAALEAIRAEQVQICEAAEASEWRLDIFRECLVALERLAIAAAADDDNDDDEAVSES